MSDKKPHLFIFGLGYVGEALACDRRGAGWSVSGTTRDKVKNARLQQQGITCYHLSDSAEVNTAIKTSDFVLSTIAPQNGEDIVLASGAAMPESAWIGYISSTAVYGDHEGGWVDETIPASPVDERGEIRLRSELHWQSAYPNTTIFRISGIYGPDRNSLVSLIEGRENVVHKQGQYFNRIHLDDIISMITSAMERGATGIYNLADDLPSPQKDPYLFSAALLALPEPNIVDYKNANLSAMAKSFYASSRRVKNDKIKRELGVELKYPTYKEGLKALAATLT